KYMYDKDWYNQYVEITAPVFAPLFQDIEGQGVWADGVNAQVIQYAKNAEGYYGYPVEGIKARAIAAKSYFTFPVAEMMNKVVTNTEDIDGAIDLATKKLEEVQSTVK
ncbi:MAG: ABC transporter substrate-binding protein, partial [Hespellia sp.]|nr:ABC transporter substrate-binding protein [Hespellia sp.]